MDDPIPPYVPQLWEEFFQSNTAPGLDLYPAVFDSALFPLQRMAELREVIQFVRNRCPEPKIVMEIGADKGGTFLHWVLCFPSVQMAIANEIRGCPYWQVFERYIPDVKFLWQARSSLAPEAISEVEAFLDGRGIDILFLDGDKCFFGRDFDNYLPLMSPGGIILLHDVVEELPMRQDFQDRASRYRDYGVIVNMSDCDRLLAGRISGKPSGYSAQYSVWLDAWPYRSCGFGYVIVPVN